jgi:hypothetical protein
MVAPLPGFRLSTGASAIRSSKRNPEFRACHRLSGQGLAGEANGFHSIFPGVNGAGSSTNSLALLVGGGTNVALSRHLAMRALDAAWLRTQLPNATTNAQNNVRLWRL